MPLIRFANNYTNTLAADVTSATATSISVTSAAGLPALPVLTGANELATPIIVGSEIMYVTAIATNTLTVLRGQEGTTAATYAAGTPVNQIVTRDALYLNPAPGAVVVNIPTGTVTYTPNAAYKYHHLTLGGSTTLTVAAPSPPVTAIEPGDELRLTFQITSTALGTQPAWHECYRRYNQGTATQGTVTLTKDTLTGFSFFYRGGGIAAAAAWVRQH